MSVETPSTSLKLSMGSNISNPIADKDLFGKENKRLYKIIILFITLDFILNELIIINDSEIISPNDLKKSLLFFFFYTLISIIIFVSILVFIYLNRLLLNKIIRFSYLIIGILYYIYQVIMSIINFANINFNLTPFKIIVFITISLTIIPRIDGFLYIKIYERTIIKIDNAKVAEEHEMFIEKVVNKLDRSTTSNIKENELEKELNKSDEEEIIFTMNKDKVVVDTTKDNSDSNQNKNKNNDKKIRNKNLSKDIEIEEEEVADLS
jgi:hypothetical protein